MRRFSLSILGTAALFLAPASPLEAQSETMLYDHIHMAVTDPPPQLNGIWTYSVVRPWMDEMTACS